MEELQSTEIIEREILEDARKKAQRIIKNADETINAKNAEWEKKTTDSINELEKKYADLKKLDTEKVMARLPVDKLRVKTEKTENLLLAAVEAWYKSLNTEEIQNLLKNELKKRLTLCEEFTPENLKGIKQKKAFFSGLKRNEAESVLKNAGLNISCIEETASKKSYPWIMLETDNIRITSSIQDLIDFIIQENRFELTQALIGNAHMEKA